MSYRLFRNAVEADLKQIFFNVSLHAIRGNSSQFMYSLEAYLKHADMSRINLYNKGVNNIMRLASENEWKLKQEAIASLDGMYVALFQALEEMVMVGVDMSKEGFPSALYTRSREALNGLYSLGLLEDNGERKYLDALDGNKTANAIAKGLFLAIRLDVVGVYKGLPKFKPVIPRSAIDMSSFALIPVEFMYLFEDMLREGFRGKAFSFTKSSVIGAVEHKATFSEDIVRRVYNSTAPELVEAKIKKGRLGYDLMKLRMYCYDLESSIHTLGLASFRPEMLDKIEEYNGPIDMSQHNINYEYLKGVFRTKIKACNTSQLESLKFTDLSGFANLNDKVEGIIAFSETMKYKNLYWLMKNRPDIFGNVEDALATREKVSPKFLKHMQFVDLPEDSMERVEKVKEMLNTGLVKFTAYKKDNTLYERFCTMNPTVLSKLIGKDYVKRFESPRNKMKYVIELIKRGMVTNRSELEKVAIEYNIVGYIDTGIYFANSDNDKVDVQRAVYALEQGLERLTENTPTRNLSPTMVRFKNVFLSEGDSLYGLVNVDNIVTISYVPVKAKVEANSSK